MTESVAPFRFVEQALPYGRTGVEIGIDVGDVLYDEHSEYGHLQVFDTEFYGRMLVIDGIVQVTTSDEFIYHEMLALTPLIRHGGAESVLIIGGGDGGALKQVLRSPAVRTATQVEIDRAVIDTSVRYLPEVSGGGYRDPRTDLVLADGAEYVASTAARYDVVILDLTDPVPGGPAERLFTAGFFADCAAALRPGGVLAMQCGSLIFQPDEVATTSQRLSSVFRYVDLHHAVVPSYQLTSFGFLVASQSPGPDRDAVAEACRQLDGPCRYLSPEIYRASRVLPPYLGHLAAPQDRSTADG